MYSIWEHILSLFVFLCLPVWTVSFFWQVWQTVRPFLLPFKSMLSRMSGEFCSRKDMKYNAGSYKHYLSAKQSDCSNTLLLYLCRNLGIFCNILCNSTGVYISGIFQASGKYPWTTLVICISLFSPVLLSSCWIFRLMSLLLSTQLISSCAITVSPWWFKRKIQESEVAGCCNVGLNGN